MVLRLLRDVPTSGWLLVAFSALRAGFLTAAVLMIARGIDLVTTGDVARGPWLWALVFALAAGLAAAAETWIPSLAQPVEERRWRARAWRRTLDDSIDSEVPAGERISRASEEVERFAHYRATFLGPLVAGAVVPLVVLIAIAVYVSWGVAIALAVGTALAPVLIAGFLARVRSSSGRYRAVSGRLTGMFLETMRVRHTMRMLGAEASRRAAIAHQARALRDEVMALLRRNQLVILITDAVFGVLALVASAVFAVAGVAYGWLTPGIGVALVLLSALLREPVDRLGRSFYVGLAGRAAGERVRAALAPDPDPAPAIDLAAPPLKTSSDAILTLRGASIVRGSATPVTGVDLEITAGTLMAIVGTSGAGKSTLALALAGLVPASGVLLGSAPASREALHDSVAYIPQRAVLFPGSVRQNLALAREGASDDDMLRALSRAGIDARSELARGLDTVLGEGAGGVSGGQAQRISIARALLTKRPLLIADEATAHLDPASSARVIAALRDATRDRTVVMITHRHDEAAVADRVVRMSGGAIVGDGLPAEVLEEGGAR
ncbi:ABC transporter permease [Microbacterium sorbitolivorans]|nr:ABC transporter permease [Microbacterium sorbitolivorans]